MNEARDQISDFFPCLFSFARGTDERSLERGYTIGREAIESGFGVLKIAEAYVNALRQLVAPVSPEAAGIIEVTEEFLLTSLAPFEMTHRGYRESIERLKKVNVVLENQTQELAAVNRELEAFSSSVSHDLRAPVRAISGFSKALLTDYGGTLSDDGRDLLFRIDKSAGLMGSLIEGLLSLSRSGHQALNLEPLNLAKLAEEILSDFQDSQPERHVRVKVGKELNVIGDSKLFRVVLYNLLSNAWKFTSKNERAEIEFDKAIQEGSEVFCVKDNGCGFDMKDAGKLFAPFQRLHSKKDFDGTGIGLATVQRIIQRHGGKIWVQAARGQGAQFCFTIGLSNQRR